jgi:hypothetical protein
MPVPDPQEADEKKARGDISVAGGRDASRSTGTRQSDQYQQDQFPVQFD